MDEATRKQCFCEGFAITPTFKVRIKGGDQVGWVDYVGRDRIRHGWGIVTVYVFRFATPNGRAFYGEQAFLAPRLELLDEESAQPDDEQA